MANKKENGYSIGNLIKTGTFCAIAGAIGGGLYTYDKEEEESHRHFRSLESNYRYALNGFQPTRDSLHNKIFTYKYHLDSLENLFFRTRDSLNDYKNWASEKIQVLKDNEQDIKNCKDEQTNLSLILDSTKFKLQNEEREVEIRDNQLDSLEEMLEKHQNRYIMETEFALLTTCIFGHNHSMNKYQYERQAKCCVKQIQKIQKKFPTDNDLKKIQDNFEIKDLCDSWNDNYYHSNY